MKYLALFALFAVAAGNSFLNAALKQLPTKISLHKGSVRTTTTPPKHTPPPLDDNFDDFKNMFDKYYGSDEQDAERRSNFEMNVAKVRQHNLKGDSSYTLGLNKYSDLSPSELSSNLMGFNGPNFFPSTGSIFNPSKNVQPSSSVDWRTSGLVTGVKDQGQCGCCYSFSATGSLEGQMKKKTGTLVSLSEQNLVDCSQTQGNDGCDGGWMVQAFKYVKSNGGLDTEDSYPFKEGEGQCNYQEGESAATVTSYVEIQSGNETSLMKAVSSVGPISVAINADGDFSAYQSGIYKPLYCPNSINDMTHAVLAVGYGSEGGQDYWILKNSWGESWGEKGFMRIARNQNNLCGVATAASYPVV